MPETARPLQPPAPNLTMPRSDQGRVFLQLLQAVRIEIWENESGANHGVSQ